MADRTLDELIAAGELFRLALRAEPWSAMAVKASEQACALCGEPWRPWAGSRLPAHGRCIWRREAARALHRDERADTTVSKLTGATVAVVRAGRRVGAASVEELRAAAERERIEEVAAARRAARQGADSGPKAAPVAVGGPGSCRGCGAPLAASGELFCRVCVAAASASRQAERRITGFKPGLKPLKVENDD